MGIRWGWGSTKTLRFYKHTCFPRTYPGIMYSTGLVITKIPILLIECAIFP